MMNYNFYMRKVESFSIKQCYFASPANVPSSRLSEIPTSKMVPEIKLAPKDQS